MNQRSRSPCQKKTTCRGQFFYPNLMRTEYEYFVSKFRHERLRLKSHLAFKRWASSEYGGKISQANLSPEWSPTHDHHDFLHVCSLLLLRTLVAVNLHSVCVGTDVTAWRGGLVDAACSISASTSTSGSGLFGTPHSHCWATSAFIWLTIQPFILFEQH